ncbi:radical SAM protein [Maridesulfovibrio bastinii]|uniref:radical SAM protein n=1 Tax=Maridesulfovibrio bastinii TaxID=47157 RepID=UPI00041411CB|nr:radical SAM protein [Maridesulfovibrio bastinii]
MKLENSNQIHEWSADRKWNPFNSYKLLSQVYRWRLIKRGQPIPQPALVTVDPINSCNLSCTWCNAEHILQNRRNRISERGLLELSEGMAKWKGHPEWPGGVEAVCIAGGGEPLLHPATGRFIKSLVKNGIEVGIVTNGTRIHEFLEELALCTWVGVSVDAGTPETFERLKGKNRFEKVVENLKLLNSYISKHDCTLGMNRPGYGVSYKYLLHSGNIADVYKGAKAARATGCKNFHLRPAGLSWDKLQSSSENMFNSETRATLAQQLNCARELETSKFNVFGITHKFDSNLNKSNIFSSCHAIFMTAVFMPPAENKDELFRTGLCCDRRGDERLEFPQEMKSFTDVEKAWGSTGHWDIYDRIKLSDCPRCTYQPHNQIFEHVIENDSMTYKFI